MKTIRDQDLEKKPRKRRPIVKESAEDQLPQNSGSMADQKTYEDYNKEKPLPENPNQSDQKSSDRRGKDKAKKS